MPKYLLRISLALFLTALTLLPVLAAPPAAPNPAQKPFEEGVALLTQGNAAQAVEKFNEALKLNQDLVEAYINRGIAQLKLEQYADAVGDFDKALELDPKSPEAYYNRALAYSRSGLFDKALEDYTRSLKYAPQDWQTYYNRGNAYLDLGKAQEAPQGS